MTNDLPTFLLSLLSEDYVFFNEGDVVWDGRRHEIRGVQLNGAKMEDLLDYLQRGFDFDSPQEAATYLLSFLREAEKDEELVVPRDKVAPALLVPFWDGDLTAIPLALYATCAGALSVEGGVGRYEVCYDSRLARGIPRFFDLVARLIWDLRACTKSLVGKPFSISFMGTLNFDASQVLGEVDEPVEGAQEACSFMDVDDVPQIGAGEEPRSAETVDESLEKLEQLAGLKQALEQIADDIGAFEGSEKEDRECCLPTELLEERACGSEFSCQVPRGWVVSEDVPNREFVLAADAVESEDELADSNHVLHCSMSAPANEEVQDFSDRYGTPTFFWAMKYVADANNPVNEVLESYEVDGTNCRVLVTRIRMFGCLEFYLRPYGPRCNNFLRVCLREESDATLGSARAFVNALAASITFLEPVECTSLSCLREYPKEQLDVEAFRTDASGVALAATMVREMVANAAAQLAHRTGEASTQRELERAVAFALGVLNDHASRDIALAVDAAERQLAVGEADDETRRLLYEAVKDVAANSLVRSEHLSSFTTPVNRLAGLLVTPEVEKVEARIEALRPGGEKNAC